MGLQVDIVASFESVLLVARFERAYKLACIDDGEQFVRVLHF